MPKQLSLEEVIFNDMKVALKENEKLKLSTVRLIRAAIKNTEISKKDKLTEDEIIGIISNHLKKLEESLDLFIKGQRPELADKAKKEIKIIKEYLPEQLSEEEVAKIVKDTILKFNCIEIFLNYKRRAQFIVPLQKKSRGTACRVFLY